MELTSEEAEDLPSKPSQRRAVAIGCLVALLVFLLLGAVAFVVAPFIRVRSGYVAAFRLTGNEAGRVPSPGLHFLPGRYRSRPVTICLLRIGNSIWVAQVPNR